MGLAKAAGTADLDLEGCGGGGYGGRWAGADAAAASAAVVGVKRVAAVWDSHCCAVGGGA
jgi:hypothetical protein